MPARTAARTARTGSRSTKIRSGSSLFWERFREDKAAVVAAVVIVLLLLIAIDGGGVASWITGHSNATSYQRTQLDSFGVPKGPDSKFVFGVDGEGRDLLVRTMNGARTSLIVGVVASLIAVLIGLVVGLTAGYFRGAADTLFSRAGDVMLAIPQLLISIGIVAACSSSKKGCVIGPISIQPGLSLVIAIIVLFTWPYIARIVRGFTLSLREKEFVEASRSLGASDLRIICQGDPPEPRRADHRLHDPADPAEHPLRGRAVVSRPRRPTATSPRGAAS